MDKDLKIGLGIILVGGALGAGGYYLYNYFKKGVGATNGANLAVSQVPGTNLIKAVITWPGTTQMTVQAAVVGAFSTDLNTIDGHFFSSQALAQQAVEAYDAGNTALVEQLVTTPTDRLVTGTETATLYAEEAQNSGAEYIAWLVAGSNTGSLIHQDPTGTQLSKALKPYITSGNVVASS